MPEHLQQEHTRLRYKNVFSIIAKEIAVSTIIKKIKDFITGDTIYPLTKATAVYMDDDTRTVEGVLNQYDGNITAAVDPHTSVDGSGFSKNFLLVNLNNRNSDVHKRWYFGYTAETVSSFTNVPTGMSKTRTVLGYREVYWRDDQHILVVVTEQWPNVGRKHYNFYNAGSWDGWSSDPADGAVRLTIVPASVNYTVKRGWAFRTGNIVTFSVALETTVQISAGTAIFRFDEGSTKRPPTVDNTVTSYNWNFMQYIASLQTFTIAGGGYFSGTHYISSGGTIAANSTTIVTGSYICDL